MRINLQVLETELVTHEAAVATIAKEARELNH